MRYTIFIVAAMSLLACSKQDEVISPVNSSATASQGKILALKEKRQFGALVLGYQYSERHITRIDWMDYGWDLKYNKQDRKITLQSYYYATDSIIYTYQKSGRAETRTSWMRGRISSSEKYGYSGDRMDEWEQSYEHYPSGNDIYGISVSFLSPWLQRCVTTGRTVIDGVVTNATRDTFYFRQSGAYELTQLDKNMEVRSIYTFSPSVYNPEYNIPDIPSFEKIKGSPAADKFSFGWGLRNSPHMKGMMLVKVVHLSGQPYNELSIENLVLGENGLPVTYDEVMAYEYNGQVYTRRIPTTCSYTTL